LYLGHSKIKDEVFATDSRVWEVFEALVAKFPVVPQFFMEAIGFDHGKVA
jgi:hypothetical protein